VKLYDEMSANHAELRRHLQDAEYQLKQKITELTSSERQNEALSTSIDDLHQQVTEQEDQLDKVFFCL